MHKFVPCLEKGFRSPVFNPAFRMRFCPFSRPLVFSSGKTIWFQTKFPPEADPPSAEEGFLRHLLTLETNIVFPSSYDSLLRLTLDSANPSDLLRAPAKLGLDRIKSIFRPIFNRLARAFFQTICLIVLMAWPVSAFAAKIGELVHTDWVEQSARFFSFSDPSVVMSLAGCLLIGILLSLLGSFMVLRKMSLLGDALGHAVLPGVCLGFLMAGTKSLLPMMGGALLSGLLGVLLIGWIVRATKIKTDAAMGMILSGFFGIGIVLLTLIQKGGSGYQSGLDKFLFGQAAALNGQDVFALAVITLIALAVVWLFFKEWCALTFDESFASTLGIPAGFFQSLLMVLTGLAVVASIQAVGVVLVSAMLIIPAATAHLLVKRIGALLFVGALLGMAGGFLGAFLSFLGPSLPTGPFMVVACGFFFLLAFLFAPRHGLCLRAIKRWQRRLKTRRENLLKSIYRLFEQEKFAGRQVSLQALAAFRNETVEELKRPLGDLARKGWVSIEGEWIAFMAAGRHKAKLLVRRHRLWELFLVREHILPADHVHVDAEEIEHILPADVLHELEAALDFATVDPHGKPIP